VIPASDSEESVVALLAQHRTVGAAPREELVWLAAHGQLRHAERGEILTRTVELWDQLVIVLSGHIAIYVDRGLGPHKAMEWGAGDVSGLLPYSRMSRDKPPGGDPVTVEPCELFLVSRIHFPAMIRECPTVTTALVHLMLDRVRRFTSNDLQDEKMMSLGKLSAGLAHELNNPASAAARSAHLLSDGLTDLEDASRAVGAAQLSAAQLEAVNAWRQACRSASLPAVSPVERADREEAIAEWLEAHGANPDAASALVDTALTFDDFESLAATLDRGALNTILRWLAADCTSRTLAVEVEKSATRIHQLVAAVKRFTYMDRTAAPEAIELSNSLNDSLALLMHKARSKSVHVSVDLEPNLPLVRAIGGDLNQIWTNLLDNALDAVAESGHVTITAARRLDFVIVHVIDDGPGIPPEIRAQIFDPFFTTKPVGQGTGLGLDIARRLVRRNDGDIEFESRPGRTEFLVTLPIATGSSGPSLQR
jgi:signal transduction histidine kinase